MARNRRVMPVEISLSELRGGSDVVGLNHGDGDVESGISCDLKRAVKAKLAAANAAAANAAAANAAAAAAAAAAPAIYDDAEPEPVAAPSAASKRVRAVGGAALSGGERLISNAFAVLGGGRGRGVGEGKNAVSAVPAPAPAPAAASATEITVASGSSRQSGGHVTHDGEVVPDAVGASAADDALAVVVGAGVKAGARVARTRSLLSSALKGIGGR
jgi:hypothetical protein